MFRNVHEGTLVQIKYAKLRAQQDLGSAQDEVRDLRKRVKELESMLALHNPATTAAAAATATPQVENPLEKLTNELNNNKAWLEQAEKDNVEYCSQLEETKKRLQEEVDKRARLEDSQARLAEERARLESEWQMEKLSLTAVKNKLASELEVFKNMLRDEQRTNVQLEHRLKEAQLASAATQEKSRIIDQLTRELAELRASDRRSSISTLSAYSGTSALSSNSNSSTLIAQDEVRPRLHDSGFDFNRNPRRTPSIVTQAWNTALDACIFGSGESTPTAAAHSAVAPVPSTLNTPVFRRITLNSFPAPAPPNTNSTTKRSRLEYEFITQELADAINSVNVPDDLNTKTVWKALNWACGVVLHSTRMSEKKPAEIKDMVNNKKPAEVDGNQSMRSSIFEDWLVAVCIAMHNVESRANHRLFNCITGRGMADYNAISKRLMLN